MNNIGCRAKYIGTITELYCKEGTIIEETLSFTKIQFDNGLIFTVKKTNLIKINESEGNSMAKLEGYKAVAIIEEGTEWNKRDYYYAIFDDGFEYDRYDNVLVSGANSEVLMIKDIITPEEAKERGRKDITAEIICKVDCSEYNKRVEERKEKAERKKEANKIKRQMDKMVEEMDKNKMYESYAKFNPELAAKLKEYKELIK